MANWDQLYVLDTLLLWNEVSDSTEFKCFYLYLISFLLVQLLSMIQEEYQLPFVKFWKSWSNFSKVFHGEPKLIKANKDTWICPFSDDKISCFFPFCQIHHFFFKKKTCVKLTSLREEPVVLQKFGLLFGKKIKNMQIKLDF